MADYPGKQYVDRIGDAADSAIKWAKDKVNVPDDAKGFEDYLLNTRSSPDDEPWGNPYFKEDPERPGDIVSSDEDYDGRYDHIYEPNAPIPPPHGKWERSYAPPSSGDVARMDQAKLKGFADNVKDLNPFSPVKNIKTRRAIAEDLNMNPYDVGSLPRAAIRELVRQYGPSARPYPGDSQLKFQRGWAADGSPKMQEFDHSEKQKAREEWDYDKMMENHAEGVRLNTDADRLEARHHANYRGEPAHGRQRSSLPHLLHGMSGFEKQLDTGDGDGVTDSEARSIRYKDDYWDEKQPPWPAPKSYEDELLSSMQEDNELLAIEAGMGRSDKDFRVERD